MKTLKPQITQIKLKKEIRTIDNNNSYYKNIKLILNETDWMIVLNTNDPNLAYDVFMKQFLKNI